MYRNREEAGRQLAAVMQATSSYGRPVVLGIPRGGVPVAAEVAKALRGELAVVVARKLGAPGYPELAIGAVTETGATYINEAIAADVGADGSYIEAERRRQIAEAKRREVAFDSHRRPPLQGRTVIVVDDGIATGATAIASVRAVKAEGAARVVLAVPVGASQTLEVIRQEVDEVVCLIDDPAFGAVGQYYLDFMPVEDEDVRTILESYPAEEATRATARATDSLNVSDAPR
jgi:putative phosphoribosyl transferase